MAGDLRSFDHLFSLIDELDHIRRPSRPLIDPMHRQMRRAMHHLAQDLLFDPSPPPTIPSVTNRFWSAPPFLCDSCFSGGVQDYGREDRGRQSVIIKEISEWDAEQIRRKNRGRGADPVPIITLPDDDDDEYEYIEVDDDGDDDDGEIGGQFVTGMGRQATDSDECWSGSSCHGSSAGREIPIRIDRHPDCGIPDSHPRPRISASRISQQRL